jgi:hypothetical protein
MNIPGRLKAVQLKPEFQTKLPQDQIQPAEQSARSTHLEDCMRQFQVVVWFDVGI